MAPRRCPYCDQVLPEYRLGVRLPEFKARIFDLVMRSGFSGIAWDDLFALTYSPNGNAHLNGKSAPRQKQTRTALKAHIRGINDELADTGYRIVGRGQGKATYRLEKRHA